VITLETIQTYKGHKPDRTVIFKRTQDLTGNGIQESMSSNKLLNSSIKSELESLSLNATVLTNGQRELCGQLSPKIINNNNDCTLKNKNDSPTFSNSPARVNSLKERSNTQSPSRARTESPKQRQSSKSPSPNSRRFALFTDFEQECLKTHNECRIKHGVPPLKLNRRLCKYSEEWAKVIAARGVLAHRSNSEYGENIFCAWSSNANSNTDVNGVEPVENWYSEASHHVFGKEPTTLKTGHFTQVVWRDSRELGVGKAKNRFYLLF
jgi:glioma pathogenesis-related protein 2